jgi:carboxyl-terminal processing protease
MLTLKTTARNSILSLLFLIITSFSLTGDSPEKRKTILSLLINSLERVHYTDHEINNEFSEKVYDLYLQRMDYNKRFFLQSDIDGFEKYKYTLDDQVSKFSLDFFLLTKDIYKQRIKDSEKYFKKILKKPFDFTIEETIESDPENRTYAQTKDELKEYWRKYYKYQVLMKLSDKLDVQDDARNNNDTTVEIRTFEELEEEARNEVKTTYEDWYHRMYKIEDDDIAYLFFNSIAAYYDPHTQYYPPEDKENFDISMSGQLEGIGAQLSQPNAYIRVEEIVPGSPCWKQGDLEVGDLILKVAQKGEEPVNVVDMRLDEAIKMIRGKKGTTVILTVRKQDGTISEIPIVRDVVEMEATFARSYIIDTGEERIGYLNLPKFYADFNKENGRSSAEDVKKELLKLKEENINRLIFDLRNNGGGSLQDAVDITGFFIKKGPVVQIRSRYGMPEILSDRDKDIIFNGDLVVMVNNRSASASEIMAAALQDYERAIIMGGNSTFGKGTVQRFIPFDGMIRGNDDLKPLGALKITTQKFYRINGGSTQLRGVEPDILLPNIYSGIISGEKDMDYAIEWDEITRADYEPYSVDYDIKEVTKRAKTAISSDTIYNVVQNYADFLENKQENTLQTLNLEQFRKERNERQEMHKKYNKAVKIQSPYDFNILKQDSVIAYSDSITLARYKAGIQRIEKDVDLHKATRVLSGIEKQK